MNSKTAPDSIAGQIITKLWRLNRIFCSSDYDACLEFLSTFLPFQIHEYRSSSSYKGWEIPPKWDLCEGAIFHEGKLIFQVEHPLQIIGLSGSFHGTVSLEELKKHLHYDQRSPYNTPYHFRQHYRPWKRDWGFCVTRNFYDSLKEGFYEVKIVTKESEGYLKVAEFVKPGKCIQEFAFAAHLDHPGMANDDLSGVAAGVELFHRLSTLETKFTYRLVIVQEMIGSVFYLDQSLKNPSEILGSCFLEMLGSATPLALQSSRSEKNCLESKLEKGLQASRLPYRKGPFRTIICNDEIVWESKGIPMCSLSRYPYPEYHSDQDNLDIISEAMLTQAVDLLYETVKHLDQATLVQKHFEGVFSLAHPDYKLYVDPGQPAFGGLSQASTMNLRHLMDEMALLPKYSFLEEITDQLQIPLDEALCYLRLWEKKGLITLY